MRNDKRENEWVLLRLGAYAEPWRVAHVRSDGVRARLPYVPTVGPEPTLLYTLKNMLRGTPYDGQQAWSCFKRMGIAGMVAFGTSTQAIAIWG